MGETFTIICHEKKASLNIDKNSSVSWLTDFSPFTYDDLEQAMDFEVTDPEEGVVEDDDLPDVQQLVSKVLRWMKMVDPLFMAEFRVIGEYSADHYWESRGVDVYKPSHWEGWRRDDVWDLDRRVDHPRQWTAPPIPIPDDLRLDAKERW